MNINTVRYGLMGVAIVVAFLAGNAVMKWFMDNTEGAKEARAVVSLHRPEFMLPDLNGQLRNVSEWDGQVLVVNFWATWCPPCQKEMPAFVELQEKYGAQGLQFVGIALDEAGKVQDFIDTIGVDYPNLLGGDKAIKASEDYGNRLGALPYTAVVNREGIIVKTYRGEVSQKSLEKVILQNL